MTAKYSNIRRTLEDPAENWELVCFSTTALKFSQMHFSWFLIGVRKKSRKTSNKLYVFFKRSRSTNFLDLNITVIICWENQYLNPRTQYFNPRTNLVKRGVPQSRAQSVTSSSVKRPYISHTFHRSPPLPPGSNEIISGS